MAEAERLNAAVERLFEQGAYTQAISLAERALLLGEKVAGPDHPTVATSLNNLGALYQVRDESAKAYPLLVRALAIRERVLGPEHLDVAESLNNLATLYDARASYSEAKPMYLRALAIREKALGSTHPLVAESLSNLAGFYFALSAYAKAEPLLLRALAIHEKGHDALSPEIATVLDALAGVYLKMGAFEKADPLYRRALAIRERALAPTHPDVAKSLGNLGGLCFSRGEYQKAEPLYRRALASLESTFGPDHPDVATAINNLALLDKARGSYDEAEKLYGRALAIREAALTNEHPSVAQSLGNLAALYQERGAYDEAEKLLRRALAIEKRALGPEHPAVATTLAHLAHLYDERAAYREAEPLAKQALAIREMVFGLEHPDVANSKVILANLHQRQGAFAEAEPIYIRSLAILEATLGPNHPSVAGVLNGLGSLYEEQGAYARAGSFYVRALAISEKALGPEHPNVAESLRNVAGLYREQGQYDKAQALYERALRINEKTFGANHPAFAACLNDVAGLYREQGVYDKAESNHARAASIFETTFGPDHPSVATSLNNLARVYWARGALIEAKRLLLRALAISEKALGPQHPNVAVYRINLSGLSLVLGDRPNALAQAARAWAIRERHLGTELGILSEPRARRLIQTLRSEAEGVTSLHAHHMPDDPGALRLALVATLQRKGRVLEESTTARSRLRRNLPISLQAELNALASKQAELAALRDTAHPEQAKALRALEAEVERREGDLSRKSAAFREQATPVTIEQVQASLPVDAALVEFVRYHRFDPQDATRLWKEAHYAAYLLRRKGPPHWVQLGEAPPLERALKAAREALANRDEEGRPAVSDPQARRALRALDALVLAPVRGALGEVPHLLISPDGPLHTIPFEALVDEQERYLIERSRVTYLDTGRDVLRSWEHAPPRSGPLVVAAPDYGPGPWSPLQGAAEEAAALRANFPAAKIFTGAAATKDVLTRAQAPVFAHVATHGFFGRGEGEAHQAPRPWRGTSLQYMPPPPHEEGDVEGALDQGGLVFAGANTRPDAVLTARDVSGLDLGGTRLVVLSACESGVGRIASGEGVYGLRRALTIAGAQSQIISLWSVNDAATGELMGAYYGGLRAGMGRSEALRRAQLTMLWQDKYKHPYYWAAFIPAGDWRPLDGGNDVPRVRPGGACGCRLAGAEAGPSGAAFAALALLAVGGARRARRAQRPLR